MLKTDFLQKQLEDIAKLIARLAGLDKDLETDKAEELLQEVYREMELNPQTILYIDPKELKAVAKQSVVFQKLEVIADLLLQTYYLHPEDIRYLQKAKEILLFIQQESPTFSFEIIQKLAEIESIEKQNKV